MAALVIAAPAFAGAKPPPYMTGAVSDTARPADDTARDADRKPVDMLMFAGVKPGDVVVDVMPGKGYFTRIFAKAVGPNGHVYAYFPSEVDPLLKGKPPGVTAVTSDAKDYPNASLLHAPLGKFVTPQAADIVWTSQNYHDFHNKDFGPVDIAAMTKGIYDSLKPGGVYIVLDHSAEAGSGTRDTDTLHRIDEDFVVKQVEKDGFRLVATSDVLRNPNDPRSEPFWKINHTQDRFILKFVKP
jgi:predicted methyltransferase